MDEYAHEHAQSLLQLVRSKYRDIAESTVYPTPEKKFEQVCVCYLIMYVLQQSSPWLHRTHAQFVRLRKSIILSDCKIGLVIEIKPISQDECNIIYILLAAQL